MYRQTFYVFAENYFRFFLGANSRHVEKQRAARHSFIIVFKALALSCQTECLTRESRKTYIEVGNIRFLYFRYIAGDFEIVVEIRLISFLSVFVPFADEHRFQFVAESIFETEPNAADTCE